jgi:hypothetical protein
MGDTDKQQGTVQTVRIERDLLRLLKVKMAQSDVRSFQSLVLGLLRGWLGDEAAVASAPATPPPKRQHQEWHDRLDLILDHGEEKDIVGIHANLEWGAESVARRKPRRRAG